MDQKVKAYAVQSVASTGQSLNVKNALTIIIQNIFSHLDLLPDGDFEYTSSSEGLERYMD